MNSLNGLLKGARYCLPTFVTAPYCRIIDRLWRKCSPKKFSPYGNSVNGAFASSADVKKEADTIWGSVNSMGCLEASWESGEKKALAIVWTNLCSPKMPQLQIVPKSMDFPCLPVRWVRTLYHSESEWVRDSVHNTTDRTDQISFLPRFPCCKASSCLVRSISNPWLCFCKSRQRDRRYENVLDVC